MKAASIHELKKSLANLDRDELLDACVRLAKYKVDNKELLTYLLMHADDEQGYADAVCDEIDEQLPAAHSIHKKTMRKIVRWMDKYIRYSGNKETELRIRIHFCRQFVERKIRFRGCKVSANMYATQLKKIEKAMEKLHPDLQFDFRYQMQGLDTHLP
ncbi:hypothetical protein SH528x_004363 [Novipirellula sp. SH528]|uniref:hypothetical protein n=1 Tax=Novipirellula sp. SH528 TaxID=3454466 RepID=UPI003FA0B83E